MIALGSVALVGSFFSIYAGTSSAVTPPPTSAPFTECPGIGASPSCEFLIVLNPGGTATVTQDSTVHTFDGSDDTLIGVVNNSGVSISTIGLTSASTIFGFDGDGICATSGSSLKYHWTPSTFANFTGSGCAYGTTGYEGPTVSFSSIASSKKTGSVNFSGGLGIGASTFFGLEGNLTSASFTVPTTTTTTTVPSSSTTTVPSSTTTTVPSSTTTTVPATTTTTVPATTTTTVPVTTTTEASGTTLPPPPPPNNPNTTLPAAPTTTVPATTTTAPPITSTSTPTAPPTSPPSTSPNIPPATVPSGAPGTGVGGAATSSDNGVLLTASGMVLFAGLAGLVLIARRRRQA